MPLPCPSNATGAPIISGVHAARRLCDVRHGRSQPREPPFGGSRASGGRAAAALRADALAALRRCRAAGKLGLRSPAPAADGGPDTGEHATHPPEGGLHLTLPRHGGAVQRVLQCGRLVRARFARPGSTHTPMPSQSRKRNTQKAIHMFCSMSSSSRICTPATCGQ